jgi:nitrite reductase/ring-hydroxylating ferredoxin subunit
MTRFLFIFVLLLTIGCSNNVSINSCFNNSISTISLDLNNPQLNSLLTPNGTAEINGGLNGIVLYNKGTGGSFTPYIALDRQCPNQDCSTPMIVNFPVLECPCDDSKYSMLDGSLTSGENSCDGGARIYTVTQNGTSLQISN